MIAKIDFHCGEEIRCFKQTSEGWLFSRTTKTEVVFVMIIRRRILN
jgi:hypothetical protein